ncbi:MAG: tRNA (guanosine(37)-N1)-methyltransferase TrmD [Bdellovibrionales bacterium]|nr:tRNA (guanosine(37)-N1)-methyltransferase TrmD [Bdellovibrionales bacterium]
MRFDVITLFPASFDALSVSKIWQTAQATGKLELHTHQLRDFSTNKHNTVDEPPYGGGPGMLISVEPLVLALESIPRQKRSKVLMLSPQGKAFTQDRAQMWTQSLDQLILVCGRYEGVDERFIEGWVDECISIGDYVLSGGELAAMVVMETLSRLIPGVIGDPTSVTTDSIQSGGLKYPQYTRPSEYRGQKVPEVLLSGDHQKIEKWRQKQAHFRTLQNRPDLLKEPDILPPQLRGQEE